MRLMLRRQVRLKEGQDFSKLVVPSPFDLFLVLHVRL